MTDTAEPSVRRRMPAAERAAQLLEVSEELFAAQGYEDTSIEDIARAAGVTRPIVYQHFGTKEGVFLACIERVRVEMQAEFKVLFATLDDPETAMLQAADIWFGIVERNPAKWKVFFTNSLPLTGALSEQITDSPQLEPPAFAKALERWLGSDTPPDVIETVAKMITGSAEHLARWWLQHPEIPRSFVVETFVSFARAGLQPWLGDATPTT